MSIVDALWQIAGFERKQAARSVETPWLWPVWRQGKPDWTETTLQGYATAGYLDNPILYACIAIRAQSAAMAPLVAYTGERDEPERVPDANPLANLLLHPNPWQSWYEFMEQNITYLDLDGNCFIYKAGMTQRGGDRAMAGVPKALLTLRSDRMRIIPGTTREQPLMGYVYEPEQGSGYSPEPFLPDEIIHIKYPNPVDAFEGLGRGTSPLSAAAKSTDVDNSATTFLKNFFDNAVAPFGMLKTKQKLVDAEVRRLRERLREQYGGVQRWGDPIILDADAEYQRLGLTMQELTFADLDMRNEARICMVLRVPPILVGARVGLERSTFANYAEARRSFWEDTLIPGIYQRFEDGFNGSLGSETVWFAYDYADVPALREDMTQKWDVAIRAFMGGLATRNEARAIVALPPVEDEQDGFRAAEQQQVGTPDIPQAPVTVGDGTDVLAPEDEAEDEDEEPEEPTEEMDEDEGTEKRITPAYRGKAAEIVGPHRPEALDLLCPLCHRRGVDRYADHGGLCVCQNCQRTFDPAIEGIEL